MTDIERVSAMRVVNVFRVGMYSIPLVLAVFLFVRNTAPFGSVTYVNTVGGVVDNGITFEGNVGDIKKDALSGRAFLPLGQGRTTVNVRVPRTLTQKRQPSIATVSMTYQNVGAANVVVTLPHEDEERKEVRHVEYGIQQNLAQMESWDAIVDENNSVTLFQRNAAERSGGAINMFSSVEAFFRNIPRGTKIQTVNEDILPMVDLDTSPQRFGKDELPVHVRGDHTFRLASLQGSIEMDFEYQDANSQAGEDTVTFQLFSGEREEEESPIVEYVVEDDDNTSSNSQASSARRASFFASVDTDGLYTLSVKASPDIRFRAITTANPFAFTDQVFLSNARVPITLYSNAPVVTAKTIHEAGTHQSVGIGDTEVLISDVGVEYPKSIEGVERIDIPRSDMILSGSGLFALREDDAQILDTSYISPLNGLIQDDTQYVLVSNSTAGTERSTANGWTTTSMTFDLDMELVQDGVIPMYLDITDPLQPEKEFRIHEISITFRDSS